MNKEFSKKSIKFANIVVTAGITGLVFFSVLPLICETIGPEEDHFLYVATPDLVKNAIIDPENSTIFLYHTHLMMENSYNEDLIRLAGLSGGIFIYFWLTISFGLIALVGIMLYSNFKHQRLSKIIMAIGCFNIIFSFLVTIQHLRFILEVNQTTNVSLASLIYKDFPIKYIQFTLLISFFACLGSVFYSKNVISLYLKQRKEKKKIKSEISKDKIIESYMEKENVKNDKEIESTINSSKEAKEKDLKFQLKTPITIRPELLEQQSQKREEDLKDQKSSSGSEGKKYRVKCPQCKNNFVVLKKEGIIKIKCPHCGKEGIIK